MWVLQDSPFEVYHCSGFSIGLTVDAEEFGHVVDCGLSVLARNMGEWRHAAFMWRQFAKKVEYEDGGAIVVRVALD